MSNRNWHSTWQDPKGAGLLNEDRWFDLHQAVLLRMANTKYGRDLLCIPQEYPTIVQVRKDSVKSLLETNGIHTTFLSDFRADSKWANVVRSRFSQFQSYSRYFLNDDNGVRLSPMVRLARSVVAATSTFYPDANVETTTVDGYVRKNDSNDWATTRGAADGTAAVDDGTNSLCWVGGNGSVYDLIRWFNLFNTGPTIGDSDTISSATYSMYITGVTETLASGSVNVFTCTPASNTAIVTADYDQVASVAQATARIISGLSTSAYNDWTLNATGLSSISKTGVTKFALRNSYDYNNTDPGISGGYSRIDGIGADTSGTTQDPKLVVVHASPFTPRIVVCS